jgi:hypothetical protein
LLKKGWGFGILSNIEMSKKYWRIFDVKNSIIANDLMKYDTIL